MVTSSCNVCQSRLIKEWLKEIAWSINKPTLEYEKYMLRDRLSVLHTSTALLPFYSYLILSCLHQRMRNYLILCNDWHQLYSNDNIFKTSHFILLLVCIGNNETLLSLSTWPVRAGGVVMINICPLTWGYLQIEHFVLLLLLPIVDCWFSHKSTRLEAKWWRK